MGLIHGNDSSNNLVPLLVDATGKPIITGTVIVQGTNSDKLQSIQHTLYNVVSVSPIVANPTNLTMFTVPAGLIYHFGMLLMKYTGTVAGMYLALQITHSGTTYAIVEHDVITSGISIIDLLDIYLEPGDVAYCQAYPATLGDSFGAVMSGYSMHTT